MRNNPVEPSILIRPHPRRFEGPQGYLLRLAEQNCLTVKDLKDLGFGFDYQQLRQAVMLPDPIVEPELHTYLERVSRLWQTQPRLWNQRFARFCPACLTDDPVWQASWELLFQDTCPVHRCWLVDRCSSCGEAITWKREHLLRCGCGSDLRLEAGNPCPSNVVRLGAILKSQVEGIPHEAPVHLQALNIDQLQRLIRFIGGYLDPAAGRKPLKLRDAGLLSVNWPVITLAAETLFHWPQAFFVALDRLQELCGEQKVGLRHAIGAAHAYLYRGLGEPAFAPVRDQFQTWVAELWRGGVARRNRRLPPEIIASAVWVPSNEATARLGISLGRLKHLIAEGVIDGEEKVSLTGRRYLTVRKDQLDRITSQIAGEMDMKAAMNVLGFGKVRMRQLLRLLFPGACRVVTGTATPWSVPRSEVESLIQIGSDLPVLNIPEEHQVALNHVLRFWNWTVAEIVGLIEDVRAGKIQIQGLLSSARGIARWVFDIKQLKTWQSGLQKQLPHWLSVVETAKTLRIHQQTAYWLVHGQFIHAEQVPGAKGICYRISRSEIERFRDTYVFGTELAAAMGVVSRKAKAILAAMGIHPISGSDIDVCRQLFYRRSNALEAALAQYHFTNSGKSALEVGNSEVDENQLALIPIEDEKPPDSSQS